MAQVIWTEPALTDLNDIAEYIAIDKLNAATSLVQHVFSVVDRLEQHPRSGRKLPELKDSRYREVIVGPCRIFYRIVKQDIYILFVMRSERRLRDYMLESRNKNSE